MTSKPLIPYVLQSLPPAEEPLTLAEVKLFLRVDGTTEDNFITSLIRAARGAAEHYTKRSFITQGWTMAYDDYAPEYVRLQKGPVQSISSVKIIARDGDETVVSSTTYSLNAGKQLLNFDATPIGHRVEINYTAGYGDAADVPADLLQGMLEHIAEMHDKRGVSEIPASSALRLLRPYRVVEL